MRRDNGSMEHAEITVELDSKDFEHDAFAFARTTVMENLGKGPELNNRPLRATLGELANGKQ